MEPLSRKERERLQRRKEIMKVSARLFAEKGFPQTTLEEIAVNAEYGTGTIYNYFQNKEEIIKSIIQEVMDSSLAIVEKADQDASDLIHFFEIYVREMFEYFSENKDEILLIARYFVTTIREDRNSSIQECYCKYEETIKNRIVKGAKNKEIRNVNPEYLFYYTYTSIYPYLTLLIKHNKFSNENKEEHIKFLLDMLFNGIKKNSNKEIK